MGTSCKLIPSVKNQKGESVPSRLFKDLLTFTNNNRQLTLETYVKIKSPGYIEILKNKTGIVFDENGEPTARSLFKYDYLASMIDINKEKMRDILHRQIGYYKKGMNRPAYWVDNQENYDKLQAKANKFNRENPFSDIFVARVVYITNPEDPTRRYRSIQLFDRTQRYSLEAKQMAYNEKLNTIIRDILSRKGISIGIIDELEEKLGAAGVTDFDKADTVVNGFIELIRLAKGERGEQVLPEEFAHATLRMLQDNNIVKRLFAFIKSNPEIIHEVLGEEYQKYTEAYEDNLDALVEETAGKLLAKHFLNREEINPAPYKNLLQRVIEAIKKFFTSTFNINELQKARQEADANFGYLADKILNGELTDEMDTSRLSKGISTKLYNLQDANNKINKTLEKIIDTELRRYKIYEKRNKDSKFSVEQEVFIEQLKFNLVNNSELQGVSTALDRAISVLTALNTRIDEIQSSEMSLSEKAKKLRDIRNYIKSYENILGAIKEVLYDENAESEIKEALQENTQRATGILDEVNVRYKKLALQSFSSYLRTFMDNETINYKGTDYTAEELITKASKDISFFDRWLDSMADSSHPLLNLFDKIVKQAKNKARLRTIKMVNERIKLAGFKLQQAGISEFEWMFQKDSEGKRTGYYIQPYNLKEYNENKKAAFEEIDSRPNLSDMDKQKLKTDWLKANTEKSADRSDKVRYVPKLSLYGNTDYINLINDKSAQGVAKLEFYNTMMDIKAELDGMLPPKTTSSYKTIKIRKDLIERVKNSDNKTKEIWENIKDGWLRRSDDVDFGTSYSIRDLENREVQTLPIFYTKLREGESEEDVSTDVISTMAAYASMAINYDEMSNSIDMLEVGRDMVQDNFRVTKTTGSKIKKEAFRALGYEVNEEISESSSKVKDRLNDFFEMQVYERYMKDEGTIGDTNIDKAKVLGKLGKLTALQSMAGNILLGISNVATGRAMMRIESICGEFYNEKDTLTADKIYATELPSYIADVGKNSKSSKLYLWDELFDVEQNYNREVRDIEFDRPGFMNKLFSESTLFFLTSSGEHWMQNRTSLALANAYKMKDANGKIISLWDAMEVVNIDPSNPNLGKRLQLKEGVTKEDGSAFTQDDINAFSRRTTAINEGMHGIYNEADKSAIQHVALGRLAIMFRKWMKPSINKRFSERHFNQDLNAEQEGYYRTVGKFMWQTAKELRHLQFANIGTMFKNRTEMEKRNFYRAYAEVGQFLLILLALSVLFGEGDDDDNDDERSWMSYMAEYQLRRLKTEIGVMIPGKSMINESFKIISSPAASINTIQNFLNVTECLNPYNYETFGGEDAIIQSGMYKGHSKAYKYFMKSPFMPFRNTIMRGVNPDLGIPYYK